MGFSWQAFLLSGTPHRSSPVLALPPPLSRSTSEFWTLLQKFIYTFFSRFIKPTNDLSSPNQFPFTILKARPQVARNFITLLLVGRLLVRCASLHTTVISYFLVNPFAESGGVEFELHRRHLSDHSPSKTDASLDVLVKIFHQMRSWCENAGRILSTPLSPLPQGYLWNTLEKLKLNQWKIRMNNISLILLRFYKSHWTHTSTK